MFLRDAWYVACTSTDLGREALLARTLCGERVVLFRDAQGQVAALEDFCPHRGAPLSLGRVVAGGLRCGYHGLVVGCEGAPREMPGQRLAGIPHVRSFPVVERYDFVWLWPGDPARADVAPLPLLPWADNRDWAYGGGLYHVACDYRLMIDNLMDLTHEAYVHASSIGQRELDEIPSKTRVAGDQVITSRYMSKVEAPPFWKMALRGHGLPDDQPVDRWQICRFSPPSHVLIEVGVALAGQGGHEAPPDRKVSSVVVDFITPESATSHWYFWGMARRFRPEDATLTAQIRDGQAKIFREDVQMLEQQQANLTRWPERALLDLRNDAGGVQSRRVLARLLAEEAARGASEPPAATPEPA